MKKNVAKVIVVGLLLGTTACLDARAENDYVIPANSKGYFEYREANGDMYRVKFENSGSTETVFKFDDSVTLPAK